MEKNERLLTNCITFEFTRGHLFEEISRDPNRSLIVKGILQRANAKNQNGRIYPKEVLVREAKKYENEFIKERRALGELDHANSEVINLKNVSHNIIEVAWEGDDLIGTIEVLSTPSGNILKSLFASNIRLGIPSRALGSVKKSMTEGADIVQDDLSVICWDFVSNPSVQGAFVFPENSNSINESVQTVKNPVTNKWEPVESIIRDILNEI